MKYGMDFLAGNRYQRAILKRTPEVVGMFLETFGDAIPFIRKLAKGGKMKVFRGQGVWSDSHKFGEKEKKKAVTLAWELNKLANEFPHIAWYYSPYCEHRLKKAEMLKVMKAVQERAYLLRLVNTPMKEGDFLPGYINETHGGDGRKPKGDYFFSFDGHNCVDANVEGIKEKFRDAALFFWWCSRFNGRWSTNDATPRDKRKGWADEKLIASIEALQYDKGDTKLPKGWLYKSHSENHGNGDKRAEKPVFIIPIKAKEVVLKGGDKVLAKLKYYGPYAGGGYRYYSDTMGHRIARGLVDVFVNGKKYGVINPAFRHGGFR